MENRNALHHVLPIGSNDWIILNTIFWGIFLVYLWIGGRLSDNRRRNFGRFLGIVAWGNFFISQGYAVYQGVWDLQSSLPLHLCSLSQLLIGYLMLSEKQWAYELVIYWGAGAVHAFITPEITTGSSLYHHIDYGISHGVIILASVYASMRMGYSPKPYSWWRVFLYTQLVLPIIGGIDWLIGANYMYLAQKPSADNPMILGDWPYYIIGLEVVVLVHFFLFYHIHKGLSNWSKIRLIDPQNSAE